MKGPSQATQIVQLALGEEIELFHTSTFDAFASAPVDGHREVWRLRSNQFRRWLARLYFELGQGDAPGGQALQDALGVLEGIALFKGGVHDVQVRVGEEHGTTYIDLGDQDWQAIAVSEHGWQIVKESPVRFWRPRGLKPLPIPVMGGDLQGLRSFVNVADQDWPLVASWLVAALQPRGPYPVLALHGEQGTAKSSTARALRALVDPNSSPLRSNPKEDRDLMIAARNGWVIALDNVSRIPEALSDGLCRLATGGGFATRELYSDAEELLIEAERPVILNGIAEVATRGDLLDRCLVLYLPQITTYKEEGELEPAFDRALPGLLGGLLDVLVVARANAGYVRLTRPPRMADFARIAVAAEPAFGWPDGTFLDAYGRNRSEATRITLDASIIADPLRAVVGDGPFTGSATELLALLRAKVSDELARPREWPKKAHVLGAELRRLAPALRRDGIEVTFDREGRQRLITVTSSEQTEKSPSQPSQPSQPAPANGSADGGDDGDDGDDGKNPLHSENGSDLAEVDHRDQLEFAQGES